MSQKSIEYLFNGEDIRVYICRSGQVPSDKVVYCFHGRLPAPGFQNGNFGQSFFLSRGIDAIHVQSSRNNWYQSRQIEPALAAAERAARVYDERIAYGSSMGAYAAVAFSGPLAVTRVSAFVPQYSPLKTKVPFETRWSEERTAVDPVMDDMDGQISTTATIYVAYDPHHQIDRLHHDLIAARSNHVVPLRFPLVDHEVLRFLGDTRLIDQVVMDTVNGVAAPERYRDLVRERRASSSTYFFYAGQTLLRRQRVEAAWTYFRRAMDLPAGQVDHYNRIFTFARRARLSPGAMAPLREIVERRQENKNLAAAFVRHGEAMAKG